LPVHISVVVLVLVLVLVVDTIYHMAAFCF
jgi:hypothetical protein